MKRIIKLISSMLLVLLFSISGIGCGTGLSSKKGGQDNTLQITVFLGGYGREYIDELASAFESYNKGITVKIDTTVLPTTIPDQIKGGTYQGDLIISTTSMTKVGSEGYFEELSDLYSSKASETEDKTIGEKLGVIAEGVAFEGKYYQVPAHIGRTGIFYNKTSLDAIFKTEKYELPLTTKELIKFCDKIKEKDGWAFVHTNDTEAEYYHYLRNILTVQYMGYEAYKLYFDGKYINENEETVFAENYADLNNVWHNARLSALKVVETICNSTNGYTPLSCKTLDFMKAQSYFWGVSSQSDYKPTAFMVNGDWVYNEVKYLEEDKTADIRMMRTPVNSEIINVLDTVNSEEQLVECIKYVDSVLDGTALEKPNYLSNKDYKKLYEARTLVSSTNSRQSISIPCNSYQKDLAKEFIKFMASDEGIIIYSKNLNGAVSPFSQTLYDASSLNNFQKSINNACKDPIYYDSFNTKLSFAGLSEFRFNYFNQKLNQSLITAEDLLATFESEEAGKWAEYRKTAGI